MFFRLIAKRQEFNFEEFFAAKSPPTRRQLITYYSNPDRVFGEMQDMATIVQYLLKSEKCTLQPLKKNNVSGYSFDAKGNKYTLLLQRIEISPLVEDKPDESS